MSASSFRQEGYDEFRWTLATVAALTCCAVALAAAIVLSATADRFEYRPTTSVLSRYDDELVQAFEALQAADAARQAALRRSLESPQIGSAVFPEASDLSNAPGVVNQCSGGSWPYSSDNCLWAADVAKRRRIVVRLKSPWCSGVLRHQPFHRCRTRPG